MGLASDAGQYIERYQNNFPLWAKEVISMDLSEDQLTVATEFKKHPFVTVKSGTTTGKTSLLAAKALWFLTTHPESKVPCTAPTGHQLEDLLFAEILSWKRRIKLDFIRNAIKPIKGQFYIDGYRDWYIVGRTIPKDSKDKLGDVLAGFHAPWLMFVVDEASGVPYPVFKGMEGSMIQKNVHALFAGNPTRCNGYFHETHTKYRNQWKCVTLSSRRSPFVNQDWIDRMVELHGEDSDFVKTKIDGEFPNGSMETLFPNDKLEESFYRHKHSSVEDYDDPIVAGLDPAAGRNDFSLLTLRKGPYIIEPVRVKHNDTTDLVPKIKDLQKIHKFTELYCEYDGIGIFMFDQLRKIQTFKTYKVVQNSRPNDPEAYRNIRSELYHGLSGAIDEIAIPFHERYFAELPEIHAIDKEGPKQIVDKPSLRSLLGFSPDYSDSLAVSTFRKFSYGHCANAYQVEVSAFAEMNARLKSESIFNG